MVVLWFLASIFACSIYFQIFGDWEEQCRLEGEARREEWMRRRETKEQKKARRKASRKKKKKARKEL